MNSPAKAQVEGTVAGVEYAICSDIGLKRTINQDAYELRTAQDVDWASDGHLFIVADGMGAHVAGEYASRLAVEEVKQATGPDNHRKKLLDVFHRANAVIFDQGQANPQFYNMGTTCSALWLLPDGALLGHIGDSRIYRQRGDRIQQLTFDHSLVWEMRAAGQISATNQAVPRNVITRCLGPHPAVDVDIEGPFSVKASDSFLLCSDGLTGRIHDAELGVALQCLSIVDAAEFLVDLANLRGGHDNITVTIVRAVGSSICANGSVNESKRAAKGTNPWLWLLAGLGLVAGLIGGMLPFLALGASGIAVFLIASLALLYEWLDARAVPTGPLVAPPYADEKINLEPSQVDRFRETFLESLAKYEEDPESDDVDELKQEVQALGTKSSDPKEVLERIRSIAKQLRSLNR